MSKSKYSSEDSGNQRNNKIDPFVFDQGTHVSLFPMQYRIRKIIFYRLMDYMGDPRWSVVSVINPEGPAPTAFLPTIQFFETQPLHLHLRPRSSCGRIPRAVHRTLIEGRVLRLLGRES